ncbi:nicotinamide riboside transporter PnuC [Polaribacter vadi]|uniref:nicotinamide riboside transporter PnuC n=1 Tax=Polaribacter TaxID=52959 RepID=UPI001C09DDEC|nr:MULTISPECIES: nicotinamide riboside transporter PnuC [Polaribacter]MBU3011090.1 nicotinamide riboside transporter PnuC [Polaribacter vadi]MDO6740904.1 nicotinamide riboside transporter PnuC [Polaribacter sp. 1_MG-2023]
MSEIFDFFLNAYKNTPTFSIVLEALVFLFGIASVWFAKKENILVYPTGLVATVISVYLLYKAEYFGDMMMNFYYSVMSIYGWWNWSRTKNDKVIVPITRTTSKEKIIGLVLVILTMIVTYAVYVNFDYEIKTENYIDIFTSGIFFTAMWFMATKKIENWTLWIFADLITVPLYAYRGLGMLSLQYLIFTILAIQGYLAWKKSLDKNQ